MCNSSNSPSLSPLPNSFTNEPSKCPPSEVSQFSEDQQVSKCCQLDEMKPEFKFHLNNLTQNKCKTKLRSTNSSESANRSVCLEMKPFDVESVDSTDTYTSCFTHPSNSQVDLTDEADESDKFTQVSNTPSQNPMTIILGDQSCDATPVANNQMKPIRPTHFQNARSHSVGYREAMPNKSKVVNLVLPEPTNKCYPSDNSTTPLTQLLKKPKFFYKSSIVKNCNSPNSSKSVIYKLISLKQKSIITCILTLTRFIIKFI